MVEYRANDEGGYSTTRVVAEDQGLERGRAEGRACVLQLREEESTTVDGSRHSRVPVHERRRHVEDAHNEVNDEDIVERLGRIFKDMPPYTPCPVHEYSAARPPNKVGNCDLKLRVQIDLK
jgi:hypothetical protein